MMYSLVLSILTAPYRTRKRIIKYTLLDGFNNLIVDHLELPHAVRHGEKSWRVPL